MRLRALIFACSLATASAAFAQQGQIEGLNVQRDGQRLLVSFELVGGVDEEMLNKIQSGLPTELEYTFRLQRPRTMWFARNYAKSTLQIIAMYNAVTQEYLVNFKHDGQLVDSRVVTDLPALHQAMTLINALAVFSDVEDPHLRTQMMVRADLGSRHVMLLFPTRINTNWARFPVIDATAVSAQ